MQKLKKQIRKANLDSDESSDLETVALEKDFNRANKKSDRESALF